MCVSGDEDVSFLEMEIPGREPVAMRYDHIMAVKPELPGLGREYDAVVFIVSVAVPSD